MYIFSASFVRARRNAPHMNPKDPVYFQTEDKSQGSAQEELTDSGKENYISSFVLSEPMSDFFHGHKDVGVPKPPPPMIQETDESPPDKFQDVALVQGEVLPSDEQVECYKQQNIWSPGQPIEPHRPLLRLKDQRPFSNVFQKKQRTLSRPLIYKEKGTNGRRDREEDDEIITSLYSDPEKRHKISKQKARNTQPKNSNALEQINQRSVYKPVGVRPEFPVYDEDIDFHPDPLQGILEDKYWLDPQEQEAVIRKYIDLAGNMQPPRVDHAKRNAPREHVPKSVDSKEAFRDAESVDRECPCREIAACGDCSRGKWKHKSNFSETNEGGRYGTYEKRKLLSINDDEIEERNGDSAIEKGGVFLDVDHKGYTLNDKNYEFKRDSLGAYGMLEENLEQESQVEGEVPSFTSNYFGRKLLSLQDDEDDNEDYGEGEDSDSDEFKTSEGVHIHKIAMFNVDTESPDVYENVARKIYKRRSIGFDDGIMIDHKTPNEKHYISPIILKPSNSGMYEYKLETEKIGFDKQHIKPNSAEEFIHMQKPFLNGPYNMAKYYVPNKFGNLLQKAIVQKKPKEKSTTLDPDLEFEIERNQTFLNVSIAMNDINISVTTDEAGLVKNNKRREQPTFSGAKGRRSYHFPLLKHSNVKTLQGTDELGSIDVQNGNNTVNSSSSTNTSLFTTIYSNNTVDNVTDTNNNSMTYTSANTTTETPTTTVNTTGNGTTELSSTEKPKKKKDDYDEDSFDAEIANDIVETVFAESQSGSVVGHNLGLCRRNESVSKYAKVSPESEQLLKKVTECILDRIRDRLEGQSCTLLDDELLQFLKWMVLSGESYKDYLARIKPEFREFKSEVHEEAPGPASSSDVDKPVQIPVTEKQTS